MEYNESPEEQELFDSSKIEYINKMGSKWLPVNCVQTTNIDKCLKLQEIAKNYGNEYMDIRDKIKACSESLEETNNYTQKYYENCMDSAERAFKWMIDSTYEEFKKHDY